MLVRYILLLLLLVFLARFVSRLLRGIMQGMAGTEPQARGRSAPNSPAVKMARDPVCGTYVVPGKALEMTQGRETLFFCSEKCRTQYLEQR